MSLAVLIVFGAEWVRRPSRHQGGASTRIVPSTQLQSVVPGEPARSLNPIGIDRLRPEPLGPITQRSAAGYVQVGPESGRAVYTEPRAAHAHWRVLRQEDSSRYGCPASRSSCRLRHRNGDYPA